jgi:hypothetical protein
MSKRRYDTPSQLRRRHEELRLVTGVLRPKRHWKVTVLETRIETVEKTYCFMCTTKEEAIAEMRRNAINRDPMPSEIQIVSVEVDEPKTKETKEE